MKIRTEFTTEEIKKYPELSNGDNMFVLKYILDRISSGKNALILTYGVTGSGKSWVNLRMSELLMLMQGKTFDTANRVFFTLKELLSYTNKKDLPPGDVSVNEELGVSMGARQWQRNIDYSQLLQTYRDLQTVGFFNLPFAVMADKHLRLLSHFKIEMMARDKDINVIKFFLLQHNPSATTESKSTYTKYLRIVKKNEWGFKKLKPIKRLYWEKPSQEVLDIYLPMQSKFKSGVRKMLEAKTNKEDKEDKEPINNKQEKATELFEKGISNKDIAPILDLCTRTIERYRKVYREATQNDKN